jgi:hypothetical protein
VVTVWNDDIGEHKMSNDTKQSELNLPDLGTLAKAGRNAGTAAEPVVESKPETIDLSHLYGEFGGKVLDVPTRAKGAEPVDLSDLYGEFGGPVE